MVSLGEEVVIRLGDVKIEVRHGLLPDPQKCRVGDRYLDPPGDIIGILGGKIPIIIPVPWPAFPGYWVWFIGGAPVAWEPGAEADWFWLSEPTPLEWEQASDPDSTARKVWRSEWITHPDSRKQFQASIREEWDEGREGPEIVAYGVRYTNGVRYPDKDRHHGYEETLADAQRLVAEQVRDLRTRRTP